MASSFALFANNPIFDKTEDPCTISVTVTKSQTVECDCGALITLTASKLSTKTAETCESANLAAFTDANNVVTNYLTQQIATKNYICPN